MAIDTYDKGDVLGITATYKNAAGTLIDPTTPKFSFIDPVTNAVTTYTYPTDSQLQRLSQGVYYVALRLTAPGIWRVRHWSTGTGEASEEGEYLVKQSAF